MPLAEINGSVGAFSYLWLLVVLALVAAVVVLIRARSARRSRE
jgi:hypothetical protein